MGNAKKPRPIRLSNRTAIGLRKTAQRVRSAWLIVMCIVTLLCTVLAVYLGFIWLPAVPLTLIAGAGVVSLMMIRSRSRYLMLISQAICTEAAFLQMEEGRNEQQRRRRAIEQLAAMHADVRRAQKSGLSAAEPRTEESLLFDLLTGREMTEEEIQAQRRNEEDDELYAASHQFNQEADEDDDLYPPKKSKKAVSEVDLPAHEQMGNTKPINKTAIENKSPEITQPEKEQEPVRRRRRRDAGSSGAPLQLIRNDQAQ